jgi:hypothetical protein
MVFLLKVQIQQAKRGEERRGVNGRSFDRLDRRFEKDD